MKKIVTIFLLLASPVVMAQIRAFDNSKAILPWLYNPAVNFTRDFQAYIGYDGRGNSSFMPQSVVAGLRMPVVHGNKSRRNPHTMIGVQILDTKQDLLRQTTISAAFAHQIDINKTTKVALGMGAGIFSMTNDTDQLVYLDHDPLLRNAGSFYNVHLNAGAALVLDDKFFVNLAAPYLVKDGRANFQEIIFRMSYVFPVNPDVNVIPAFNLDTYNKNMIYGADLRVEWRKIISVLAGADRFKYHAGMLFDIKPVCIGYTYGQNFDSQLGNIASHQISVYSHIKAKRNNF